MRARLARQYVAGRAVHRNRAGIPRLVTMDKTILEKPQEMGKALIESRQHIWFTQPPPPVQSSTLLRHYFHGRQHQVSDRPPIDLQVLRRGVVQPKGSAPGVDGKPYEFFQLHLCTWYYA